MSSSPEIAWGEIDTSRLDAKERERAAAGWFHRMKQEHLAVSAFSLLAGELAEDGVDEVILELVTRAASDELRHAIVCRKLANAIAGKVDAEVRFKGAPRLPMHEGADPSTRVLRHMVEMCCINETCTGIYLTELRARATEPVARAAVDALLRDEIDHGRVGWAYLASRARDGSIGDLSAALPDLVQRSLGAILSETAHEPSSAPLASVAHMTLQEGRAIYREALADVILPGFARAGLDIGPTRALADERGWL